MGPSLAPTYVLLKISVVFADCFLAPGFLLVVVTCLIGRQEEVTTVAASHRGREEVEVLYCCTVLLKSPRLRVAQGGGHPGPTSGATSNT